MNTRFALLPFLLLLLMPWQVLNAQSQHTLSTTARARQILSADGTDVRIVETNLVWDLTKTAVVICDMWDQHWCVGATRRVAEMAPRMNQVVNAARDRGALIIHCPSSTLKHYEGTPQRELARNAKPAPTRVPLQTWCHLDMDKEAPLPIDDSDGGCDDLPRCQSGSPWTRQIATIEIKDGDAITDSSEAYYLMQERGIENVIVMGVHVNMCVLGRPFSIRQMINQGKNVVLMRDLTDSMYNSRQKPYVDHFRGTALVVEHIEKYWCPTITSTAFLGGEPFHFKNDVRPHVVFIIGEREYETKTTLPEFAHSELEYRGIRSTFVHAKSDDPNNFPGIEAIKEADLILISVRRRTPPKEQLDLIRRHLEAGKPLVGIRTASHAFDAKLPDAKHASWATFDRDILGAHYQNHYGHKPQDPPNVIRKLDTSHPVLTGIPATAFAVTSSLYKSRDLAETVTPLLVGEVKGISEVEPVAWVNTAQNRRVFYTSLGSPDDFKLPAFRRLLLNGILWSLNKPIPPELPTDRP